MPARGVRNLKIAQSGLERMQNVFWRMWTKSLLHWCKRGLRWCKPGLHWCKTLSGDHLSSWSKHRWHPLLTTLGTFEVSDPCSRQSLNLRRLVRRGFPEGTWNAEISLFIVPVPARFFNIFSAPRVHMIFLEKLYLQCAH